MNIAIIGSYDESLISFRLDFIKALLSKNHNIYVVAPTFKKKNESILRNLGVNIISIGFKRTSINLFSEFFTIYRFYVFLKKYNFDMVFLYTLKPVIFGSISARLAKIKKINSLITGLGHFFISNSFYSKIIRSIIIKLYKISLSFNENVIFQNKDDKNYFLDLKILQKLKANYHVINGSGVDTGYFKKIPLPTKISFILIARLLKEKGVIEYLKACKDLCPKYKNIKFNLGGWFDDHPDSVNLSDIENYKLPSNFEYLGNIDDVRDVFVFNSVVVLPSYREGLPRILLEAMSVGRAIITTNVPGCREAVINNYNGFLVQAKNYNELKIAMEKIILNSDLIPKMAQNGRNLVKEKFDVNMVNKQLLNIIF